MEFCLDDQCLKFYPSEFGTHSRDYSKALASCTDASCKTAAGGRTSSASIRSRDARFYGIEFKSRTMTSIERIDALRASVEYIHANSISGDIVECGVWRGGSMMAVALTLLRLKDIRRLWLYDTFSGMTPPESEDVDFAGRAAKDLLATEHPDSNIWANSSLTEVQAALSETGYPAEQIEFIVGPVESSIPRRIPEIHSIAETGHGLVPIDLS